MTKKQVLLRKLMNGKTEVEKKEMRSLVSIIRDM
jgi:hypothetical protein